MYPKTGSPAYIEREIIFTHDRAMLRVRDPEGNLLQDRRTCLSASTFTRLHRLAHWINEHPIPGYAAELNTSKWYVRYTRPAGLARGQERTDPNTFRRHMAALCR